MSRLPQLILETANFHGGDAGQLERAVDAFAAVDYPRLGIKFHAFDPDRVALPDFSWYPVVKNFFVAESRWAELIARAAGRGLGVWLDLFCAYGVAVLGQNRGGPTGSGVIFSYRFHALANGSSLPILVGVSVSDAAGNMYPLDTSSP